MKIAMVADFRMNFVKNPSGGRLGLGKKWIIGGKKKLIVKYMTLAISELVLI